MSCMGVYLFIVQNMHIFDIPLVVATKYQKTAFPGSQPVSSSEQGHVRYTPQLLKNSNPLYQKVSEWMTVCQVI